MSDQTKFRESLARVICDLVDAARNQKRRVKDRLRALRGDDIRTPSRGAIQKNGLRCVRWHYWLAATIKHEKITEKITAVKSCIPTHE